MPLLIAAHQRLREGNEPINPIPGQGIAYNFLYTLQGKVPDPKIVEAFDMALILHADHELNASTFAARVTAATMADIYSCVTSAIGALKGPLHGGANMEVMQMIEEIGTPENAEPYILDKLENKVKIPGFGHRVYRCEDPRVTVLRDCAESISELAGEGKITRSPGRSSASFSRRPRSIPMSTSIPPRCTMRWGSRRSCSLRSSRSAGWSAGRRISSNSGRTTV